MTEIPEWIDGPEIAAVTILQFERESEYYAVGQSGVTKIERTFKSGEMSHIPYVRVWKGAAPYAEFCQHRILGVYFQP